MPSPELAPDRKVAAGLNVNRKTLKRWDKKRELKFPPPIYINGRTYRDVAEVAEWTRRQAVASAARS